MAPQGDEIQPRGEARDGAPVEAGAWPFVTLRRTHRDGRHLLWRARDHRKGLFPHLRALDARGAPFWQTPLYNWLTGLIFVLGASLFLAGSIMSLWPWLTAGLPPWTANATFFAGSIPFTTAGYLQLFQAANADRPPSGRRLALFGWSPRSPGWISAATQSAGTVAFNFNTFDVFLAGPSQISQNLDIWTPGMIGSVLFLISGYLAYIEAGHAHFSRPRRELAWWIVAINLLGCVAFMIASTMAFAPAQAWPAWVMFVSYANLGFGAFCFLVGAALSMREARNAAAPPPDATPDPGSDPAPSSETRLGAPG